MTTSLSQILRSTSGREALIEDTVRAAAERGAFDGLLTHARTAVRHGRHGRADVEIFSDDEAIADLGIEVKTRSQVNVGRYGGETPTSQLAEIARHTRHVIIITTAARAAREQWPERAEIMTLDDLADLVEAIGLTAEDVVRVALGDAA